MIKKLLALFYGLMGMQLLYAQEHKWAFGFYADVQFEKDVTPASFGVQGKYDIGRHSAFQAQVHGRSTFVSVGGDYLFAILDQKQNNFNVFLGAGVAQDFFNHGTFKDGDRVKDRASYFMGNGQIGLSYSFQPIPLSVYAGYKLKYNFDQDKVNPNFMMFGLRYHLW